MFFKLCQKCEHFFFSDEEYRAHKCFRNEKKNELKKVVPEKKETSVPPAENAENASVSSEKERRKQILLAMKTRLANAKADCATLKFDATKEMYIRKFGAGEYEKLEKSFCGDMKNG